MLKNINKILEERAIKLAKKEAKKIIDEKEYTLKLLNCFNIDKDQEDEYEKKSLKELKHERDYVEVEIEKQKKYTSDFRLNIFSVLTTIIAVILTIVIFMFSNALTQIKDINEKEDIANQKLIVLQHTYANEDKTNQENDEEEVHAQADDLNEQLTQFNEHAATVQANINFNKSIIIVFCILLIIVLVLSLYVYLTYGRNNKRSAIILVAYKKRLEFIEDLLKKNNTPKESSKNETKNDFNGIALILLFLLFRKR